MLIVEISRENVDNLDGLTDPSKDDLCLLYLNARSIRNKFDEVEGLISKLNVDVCLVTESWLRPGEEFFFQYSGI